MEDLKQLKRRVEVFTNINNIAESTRKFPHVSARAFFYNLAEKQTNYSPEVIGAFLGRDRTTVLHAREQLKTYIKQEPLKSIHEYLSGVDVYEDKQLRVERLEKQLFEAKAALKEKSRTIIPEKYLPLSDLIKEVPEHHIETVRIRLEAIVKMLPKT